MIHFFKQVFEAFGFARQALRENLLRTTLSLLGVTVGIFAIIGVLTLVDTLDNSIRKSLSFLGNKVIYVEKWPWSFSDNYPWWKYYRRPYPTLAECEFLEQNLTWASAISIFDFKGGLTIKYKNNNVSSVLAQGISYRHNQVSDIDIKDGRYFTKAEIDRGVYVVILGANIAEELFDTQNPVGNFIKIKGIKFTVAGVIEKQGDNLLGTPSNDELCIMPYKTLAKVFATLKRGLSPTIAAKGFNTDRGLVELENEIKGMMRSYRGIRAAEEENFALNRPEAITSTLDNIIRILTIASWIIGGFSILIGGFGIVNIMIVSVKERTHIIGIQKSLGAENYFILLQFLFEAIFLSFLGGGVGVMLVSILSVFSTDTFPIALTFKNVFLGLGISCSVGIISGIVPAISASLLDPVIAIRTK